MTSQMHTSSPTSSTQGVYSFNGLRQYDSSPGEESPGTKLPKPPIPPHTRDSSHSSVGGATFSRQENIWNKMHSYLATNENVSQPEAQEREHFHSRSAKRRPRPPKRRPKPTKRRHKPIIQSPVDRGSDDETRSLGNAGISDSNESHPDASRLDSPELSGTTPFSWRTRPPDNAEPAGRDGAPDNANAKFDKAAGRAGAAAYEASSENNSRPQEKSLPKSACCDSLCWICRRPFQISSVTKDNWKCFHQPIVIGRDGDLPPAQRCVQGVTPAIHDCCWEVACQVLKCSSLSLTRRIDVIKHIQYLGAFAEKTPFDTETNSLDLELFTDSDCMSTSSCDNPQQPVLETILSSVVRLLQQQDTIILIDDLNKVDPCIAQWMILAHSYSVQMNRTPNVRPLLERVVRNLRESDASRFPKAYNFRVAWYNVQQAIGALEAIPRPEMILLDPRFKGQGQYLRYRMSMDKCRRFSFFFYPCNISRHYRLTGVVCDGFSIGSCPVGNPFMRAIHLPVEPLRGLYLAQTSTGQITAVKFKNRDGWGLTWYGELAHACDVVQIELNESNQDVVFHFDVSERF